MNSLYETVSAMEGFLDPETTASKLLDAVKENISNKVTTVDEAAALELRLSQEAAQFNDCLTTISNAIRKFEQGEISREEMVAESTPCVNMLKNKCEALSLANVNCPGDDITEEEIATLREYIVGCKDIVTAHKEKLQGDCCAPAAEGLLSSMIDMSPAMEGAKMAKEIRHGNDAETAKQLYMQARRLYGLGSKEKAQKHLQQAKKLYEKCLKQAKANAKMVKVDRKVSKAFSGGGDSGRFGYRVQDKQKNKEVASRAGFGQLIAYFEDRIDACDALQMQWNNKAGNKTFAETKKALTLERAKTRRGNEMRTIAQSEVKNAMNNYKPETPEERANESALIDIVYACESMLNDMDMEDAIAMEADENGEGGGGEDPKIARLRELAVELKKAQTNGDEAAAKKISAEMEKLLDQIEKDAYDSYTQEDYDAAKRKRIKAAAIIAGSIAAVGVGTAVGVKTGAFKKAAGGIKAGVEKIRAKKAAKAEEKKQNADESKRVFGAAKNAFKSLKGQLGKLIPKKGKSADTTDADAEKRAAYIANAPEAWVESMESYMDSLELNLAMEAAMEAEGGESGGSTTSPSSIGSRLRKAFSKLKRAKNDGDATTEREAEREVREAAEDLETAEKEADTPEKKSKVATAAKIGLAAAATAVVGTVGVTAIGAQLEKASKGKNPTGASKLLINASKFVRSKATTVANAGADAIEKTRLNNKVKSIQRERKATKMVNDAEALAARNARRARLGKKPLTESFLSSLAFGLESDTDFDDDDEYFDPEEDAKSFDDDDAIDDAVESWRESVGEVAAEAMIDVMLAEDGITDPED